MSRLWTTRITSQECQLITKIGGWIPVVLVVVSYGGEAALDSDRASPEEAVVHAAVFGLVVEDLARLVVHLLTDLGPVRADHVVLRVDLGQPARETLQLFLRCRLAAFKIKREEYDIWEIPASSKTHYAIT